VTRYPTPALRRYALTGIAAIAESLRAERVEREHTAARLGDAALDLARRGRAAVRAARSSADPERRAAAERIAEGRRRG
jgi:hypothetical protein